MSEDVEIDLGADDQAAKTCDPLVKMTSGGPPQFLPDLLKRPIMIRMMDGRPIKGVLEAYNNYELHLDIGQGKRLIVFKGAVSSIDYEKQHDREKAEAGRKSEADR